MNQDAIQALEAYRQAAECTTLASAYCCLETATVASSRLVPGRLSVRHAARLDVARLAAYQAVATLEAAR